MIDRFRAWMALESAPRTVAIATFVLMLVLLFPGFMSPDSLYQYLQATSKHYDASHPPLMAYLWRAMNRIIDGPTGMLALQCGLAVSGIFLLAQRLAVTPRWLQVFLPPLVLLYPPVFGIFGAIWKDVVMAAAFLFAFAMAAAPFAELKLWRRVTTVMLAVGATFVATGVRHNAIGLAAGGALSLLAFRVVPLRPQRTLQRLILATAIGLVSTVSVWAVAQAVNRHLAGERTSYVWQYVVGYDLLGMSLKADQVLFADEIASGALGPFLRTTDVTVDAIRGVFSPTYYWPTFDAFFKATGDSETAATLRAAWLRAIKEHPGAYLAHRWQVFSWVIRWHDLSWAEVYMDTLPPHSEILKVGIDIVCPLHKLSKLQQALAIGLGWLATLPLWFAPYVYALLGIALAVRALFRLDREGAVVLFLVFSGLAYEMTYFFGAASADYRYSHWLILSVWLSLLLTLGACPWATWRARGRAWWQGRAAA